MHKINEIISMPVLSLYEGELVGQISKIYFDKKLKKISYFIVNCEGDLSYILYPKNIYKLGKNAATIKNLSCLILELETNNQNTVPMPINSKVYTIQGEYIGKIVEISIDDKFNVANILLDNNNFIDICLLASCSKNTIILFDENSNINLSNFKNRIRKKLFKIKENKNIVQTLPYSGNNHQFQEQNESSITINNPQFLLGRIATTDIMLNNKKVLVKANSTITQNIILLAQNNNKIKDLTLNSKQK